MSCEAARHGTTTAYNHYGCRCPEARAARKRGNQQRNLRLLEEGIDGLLIPGTGVARRLQALAVAGWSERALAKALGTGQRQVQRMQSGRFMVGRDTALRVDGVYESLRDTAPAPSRHVTRTKDAAAGKGWVSHDLWDGDSIDDPKAKPRRPGAQGANWRKFHVEDLEWLVDAGESWTGITARFGLERDSIAQTLRRKGRVDLLERLARREAA